MRIHVDHDRSGYYFYIWSGVSIVDSRYGFATPILAAESAAKSLGEMRRAKRIARRARWPWLFFYTSDPVASTQESS